MLISEAAWIGHAIEQLPLPESATVFDVGSSTETYRTRIQPYVDSYIFAPVRDRGCRVVHIDAKEDVGVDVVYDLAGDAIVPHALFEQADLVLCCNLLEHVEDRLEVAQRVVNMAKPGAWILVTVPFNFPYHADPIDNMFRPQPDELGALFESLGVTSDRVEVVVSPYASRRVPGGRLGLRLVEAMRAIPSGRLRPRDFSVSAVVGYRSMAQP